MLTFTKKSSFSVSILSGCVIALFATATEAAPHFFQEGLDRVESHEYGATAFYNKGASENRVVSSKTTGEVPDFFKKGLVRVDKHAHGATAFYE